MKNTYTVSLTNHQGATFDSGEFTSIKEARSWAAGRGQTYEFGQWHNYTVDIRKNGEPHMEYKTH